MNLKICKRLRGIAQAKTVGKPESRWLISQRHGNVVNDPNSTRGVYRSLKRQLRRMARGLSPV